MQTLRYAGAFILGSALTLTAVLGGQVAHTKIVRLEADIDRLGSDVDRLTGIVGASQPVAEMSRVRPTPELTPVAEAVDPEAITRRNNH